MKGLLLPVFLPSALFSIGEAILIPVIPAAAQRLGADLPTAGLVAGMITLGSLFFDVPAVRLVNRFGERRAMLLASLVASAAIGSLYWVQNLLHMAMAIFIAGSMAAVFGLARHGYLAEHVPFSHRARALGLLGGTFRFGAFAGPMLGALVISTVSVEAVYLTGAVICLTAAIPLALGRDDAASAPDSSKQKSILIVARQEKSKLLQVGLSIAILPMARAARSVGLPLWGVSLGLPEQTISLLIGIAAAVDLALFFVSGQVMDRFGRRAAVVPTLLAMGIGMFAITFASDSSIFLIVAICISLANALGSGIVLTLGADLAPAKNRNEFLASFRFLMDLGLATGPLALAALTAAVSLPFAFWSIGTVCVIGAANLWRVLPKFGIR